MTALIMTGKPIMGCPKTSPPTPITPPPIHPPQTITPTGHTNILLWGWGGGTPGALTGGALLPRLRTTSMTWLRWRMRLNLLRQSGQVFLV